MSRVTGIGGSFFKAAYVLPAARSLLAVALVAGSIACERRQTGDGARPPSDSAEAAAPSPAPAPPEVVYDVRHGVIVLADSSRFRTTLFDQRVLGQLPAAGKQPYYLLSGRSCVDCDVNLALYLHSPSDGPMRIGLEQPRYPYPGRETFYEDGTLQYEARAFFGDCAAAYPNAVIWYQRRRDADRWRSSVRVLQVHGDSVRELLLEQALPDVAEAAAAVRAGHCREIRGIDRASEP
jgi:hypothetical protein